MDKPDLNYTKPCGSNRVHICLKTLGQIRENGINLRTHSKGRGTEWEGVLYGLTFKRHPSVWQYPSVVQRIGVAGN